MKHISLRVWPLNNQKLRRLSPSAREEIMELVMGDVEGCFINNGRDDTICKQIAKEMEEMGEYLEVDRFG